MLLWEFIYNKAVIFFCFNNELRHHFLQFPSHYLKLWDYSVNQHKTQNSIQAYLVFILSILMKYTSYCMSHVIF